MQRCAGPSIRAKSFQNLLDLMSSYTHTHTHTHTLFLREKLNPSKETTQGILLWRVPKDEHTHTHTQCAAAHTVSLEYSEKKKIEVVRGTETSWNAPQLQLITNQLLIQHFPTHTHTKQSVYSRFKLSKRVFMIEKGLCVFICVCVVDRSDIQESSENVRTDRKIINA